MFNITHYQRNANQNYSEIPPHTSQNGHHQKNLQTINAGEREDKREPSCTVWECKLIQPLWKTVWRLLKKLGIKPTYDPAIPLLDIYPEEIKSEKDTCTPIFITALFTVARTWKQPRCPSADGWIRKLWYIYTVEYYSAIKKCICIISNEVDETGAYYTE